MPMEVALAAKLLPIIKMIIIQSSKDFLDIVSDVRIGAPNVTPSAYIETVNPAVVTDIFISPAINGRSPTLINSVVPIAKALTASAKSANILMPHITQKMLTQQLRELEEDGVINRIIHIKYRLK